MSDSRRDRWQRARIAGGRPISPERWRKIVDQAVVGLRTTAVSFPTRIERSPRRMEVIEPGDVVLRATDVLGLEMALLMAEQFSDEIVALADEPDIDEARRDRLRATIARARVAVEHALKQRGES